VTSIEYFVKLRTSIRTQVFEDSENSIQNIIQSLAWNDSIYRTFNEGLRLARSKPRKARIPKSLVEYIHRSHLAYVVITLRKLYDDKSKGSRAVNSLRTITQKLSDNTHLFTRKNYVAYDGMPYISKAGLDWKIEATINGRHHEFDLLCKRKPDQERRTSDTVDPEVPRIIHEKTVLRQEIEQFANKFLAHSAAASNRPNEDLAFKNLTLARIQIQYKNAIWATQQIGRFLCEHILTEVPSPQFDVLDQWDTGIFDKSIKKLLMKYWYQRMAWWRKWTKHYWDSNRMFLHP
jgi:hypothetical protein